MVQFTVALTVLLSSMATFAVAQSISPDSADSVQTVTETVFVCPSDTPLANGPLAAVPAIDAATTSTSTAKTTSTSSVKTTTTSTVVTTSSTKASTTSTGTSSTAKPTTTSALPTTAKTNGTTTTAKGTGSTGTSTGIPAFTGAANALAPVFGFVGLGLGALALL